MDHTAALSALPPARKDHLTRRSNTRGLVHLAGYLAALGLTTAAIVLAVPFWPLALLAHGILLSFLFTLSHECTHFTPFRTRWINNAVGHAVSLPLLLPFTWFRYFHLAHHKFTNDPARDPEIAGHGRPDTWRAYLIYLSGWSYWSGNIRTLFANATSQITAPYLPPRQHRTMRIEARVLLALLALLLLSLAISPLVLWLWIVPALIGQPFLRLYLLAEHGHCPPVANMLENSRTTFTNRIIRALAWNMPYHAEHHSFPNVPFHRLPDLHRDLAPHLKSTSAGYAEFTGQYAQGLARSERRPPQPPAPPSS